MLQAPFRYHVILILTGLAGLVPRAIRTALRFDFKPFLILVLVLLKPAVWLAGFHRDRKLSQSIETHRALGLRAHQDIA